MSSYYNHENIAESEWVLPNPTSTDNITKPMNLIFNHILERYEAQTKKLFQQVADCETATLCNEMQNLLDIDNELQNAVEQLKRHQKFQKKLNHVGITLLLSFILINFFFSCRLKQHFLKKILILKILQQR